MGLTHVAASSLPSSPDGFKNRLSKAGDSTYLFWIVDNDAATGQPWCPDVRAALPVVENYFAEHPDLSISAVSVGSRAAYVYLVPAPKLKSMVAEFMLLSLQMEES